MTLRVRLAILAVLLAGPALSAGQAPPSAQQTPTFKLEVDYVEVDALVTDRAGRFVRDLKKEDFQVFEDGRPQTVSAFSIVDIPIEREDKPLGRADAVLPDVRSNARPFDGRVYVMVIDDVHTLFGRTDRVKRAARLFIERNLGANDLMAVVHTAGPSDASQEFTSNKRLLLTAVDRTSGQKLRSATLGKTEEYYNTKEYRQSGDPLRDPDEAERAFKARQSLDVLRQVADWFSGVRGRRKAILFVSEGIDYDITNVFANSGASTIMDTTREVIAAATRSNVSIYGIDPRGLTSLGDEDVTVMSYPDDTSLGLGAGSIWNEVRLSQDSLRTLSDETGGFATVNRNDFAGAYQRLVRDNSSYYVLAYYPPNPKRDNKYHKIEVRVTRPGLDVRARKGYALPKAKAPSAAAAATAKSGSAEVREALNSPLPISGFGISVLAAPFKGAQGNASVLLGSELLGRDMRLEQNDKVELTYLAIDAQGKVRGSNTDSVQMNLKPETKARVQQSGMRLLNRLDLPPGRYQIRVAAHDGGGGSVGSVIYDLEVPDFYKAPLSMSGLVLSSAAASAMPTAHPDEELKDVLPGPPVAVRLFSPTDQIALFAEIYDNQGDKPHKIDILTTITSDDGKVVYKAEEERASSDMGGKRGGYGYTARIEMRDLVAGAYVLKVEARSRLGEGVTASREIQFSVAGSGDGPAR